MIAQQISNLIPLMMFLGFLVSAPVIFYSSYRFYKVVKNLTIVAPSA